MHPRNIKSMCFNKEDVGGVAAPILLSIYKRTVIAREEARRPKQPPPPSEPFPPTEEAQRPKQPPLPSDPFPPTAEARRPKQPPPPSDPFPPTEEAQRPKQPPAIYSLFTTHYPLIFFEQIQTQDCGFGRVETYGRTSLRPAGPHFGGVLRPSAHYPLPRPSSLIPRPSSLIPRPSSLIPRPSPLIPRPSSPPTIYNRL